MKPVSDGGGKANAGEEVLGFFIIARRNAAPVFQPTKGPLNKVAHSVGHRVERRRLTSGHFGRDHGVTGLRGEESADVVSIVGFIAEQGEWRRHCRQQRAGAVQVVHVAASQEQGVEAPSRVAQRVDFGGATPRKRPIA